MANKVAAFVFDRCNPPTKGHELLANTLANQPADAYFYLSHKYNPETDPLDYDTKYKWCNLAFGDVVNIPNTTANSMLFAATELYEKGYNKIIYICGSEYENSMKALLDKYNGQESKHGYYRFDSIEVSTLTRIMEDVPVEKISASMQRAFVRDNDFDSFRSGCPSKLNDQQCLELFNDIKIGMGLGDDIIGDDIMEDFDLLEDQNDIVGSLKLNFIDGSNKEYRIYRDGVSSYGLIMGEERHYKDWVEQEDYIESADLDLNDKLENVLEVTLLPLTPDAHVKFRIGKYTFTGAKGGGRSMSSKGFSDKETTALQEVIYGLILKGEITAEDVKDYLLNSDPEKKTGVFSLGLIPPRVDDTFHDKWNYFLSIWGNPFQVIKNSVNTFYQALSPLNLTENDIKSSRMLHSRYDDGLFINKKDTYDKSDIYFVFKDLDNVVNTLNSLQGADYCEKLEELTTSGYILGVSLKKPEKSLHAQWDIKGFGESQNSITGDPIIIYHMADSGIPGKVDTVNLLFRGIQNTPKLEIRSGGSNQFVLQWGFNSAAWAGRAKEAFKYLFGQDAYDKVKDACDSRNFIKVANIILKYLGINIASDYKPAEGTEFRIEKTQDPKATLNKIFSLINLSVGYNARNTEGKRLTAPYLKVC